MNLPGHKFLSTREERREREIKVRSRLIRDLTGYLSPELYSCVYITIRCTHCGEVRQALPDLPESNLIECPECQRSCTYFLLGVGLTRKVLPFHDCVRSFERAALTGTNSCRHLFPSFPGIANLMATPQAAQQILTLRTAPLSPSSKPLFSFPEESEPR